ncbi:MAG: hypothetical protein GF331_21935 [Chitinivibrionales bacterium]|nr:hypothetical protein [Chitinivibrionales bacterium]
MHPKATTSRTTTSTMTSTMTSMTISKRMMISRRLLRAPFLTGAFNGILEATVFDRIRDAAVLVSACVAACLLTLSCTEDEVHVPPTPGLLTMQETGGGVSRPVPRVTLPASWDENWFASPAVYDLDNDGAAEIIASRHSVLYVWDTAGTLLWRAPVGENASSGNDHGSSRMYCSPAVGDLDGDGMGEIAIAYSYRAAVYEHDGMLKAGWPRPFPGATDEIRSIAAADIDNDTRHEILVVKTSHGPVTMVWDIDGSAVPGWPQADDAEGKNDFGGYNQNIGAADLDRDGYPDIVSTYDICHIGVFRPDGSSWLADTMFAGTYASSVPLFHDIELAKQGWGPDGNDRDELTDSPPAFADMDNDGRPEIVVFSDHELAGEYRNRGNSLWVLNPDMTRVPAFAQPLTTGMPLYTGYEENIVQVAPAPCIAPIAGQPHVVVPSYDGFLRCYAPDASVLWRVQFDVTGGAFIGCGEAVAGDLNGDGAVELVFTTYSTMESVSHLVILGCDGALLHRVPIEGRGSMAAPTLADVDGDGVLEIVVSLKDHLGGGLGGVQVWDVPSATAGPLPWPTGRGNYCRTGEPSGS